MVSEICNRQKMLSLVVRSFRLHHTNEQEGNVLVKSNFFTGDRGVGEGSWF